MADVQAYVDFLMEETDLRLGVCDWGYCVYRVETAACFGNEKGPTPCCGRKHLSLLRQLCRHGQASAGLAGAPRSQCQSSRSSWPRSGQSESLPRRGSPNATASSAISIMERMHAMARKTGRMPALTPHEKRLRNTDRKLRDALERLVKGLPTHPDLQKRSYRLTVATLAREARVGRNAIYTNHRSMIDELRRASDRRIVPEKLAAWEDKLAQQRALIQVLQIEERRMVTEKPSCSSASSKPKRRLSGRSVIMPA